jgi:glycosyltransferase involved in cell wall biosynthesis
MLITSSGSGASEGMKIFFVANTSFFLHNFLLGTMRRVREEGSEVVAAAPVDGLTPRVEAEGFRVHPLREMDRKGSNPFQDLRLLRELYGLYRREKPDLVLHFTIKVNVYGSIAAKLAKTKSVCTVTGLGWLFTEKGVVTAIGGMLYKILYRIAFAFTEKVIFQNHDDRDFFLQRKLVSNDKALVTPGVGVDTGYFSPQRDTSEQNKRRVSFLLIARMLWDKGIGEFVEAARKVKQYYPDAEFCLLGPIDHGNRSAIPRDSIERWEADGLIRYLGATDDVRPFISRSHAVVLPSYREAIGKTLLEAMSMGKPIIAADSPGCRDTVEEGKNGFLVPVKNSARLADAFMKFIDLSVEEREKMGSYGRDKVVREFDQTIVNSVYIDVVKHALAEAPHKG